MDYKLTLNVQFDAGYELTGNCENSNKRLEDLVNSFIGIIPEEKRQNIKVTQIHNPLKIVDSGYEGASQILELCKSGVVVEISYFEA